MTFHIEKATNLVPAIPSHSSRTAVRVNGLISLFMTCLAAVLPMSHAQGQTCGAQWLSEQRLAGVGYGGYVLASTEWDPDGAGPLPSKLVVGGTFAIAGNRSANRIAIWDGSSWSNLGEGFNGAVNAVAVRTNGELIAAGTFTASGAATLNRIARWDGTAWIALGSGMNGNVRALQAMPNGDIVAAGDFTTPGLCIARWNGTTWSAVGGGISATSGTAYVRALALFPNGDLAVGGSFNKAGVATGFSNLARWNGSAWTSIAVIDSYPIGSLAVLGTDLFACALQPSFGGPGAIYAWRRVGAAWQRVDIFNNALGDNAPLVVSGGQLFLGVDDRVYGSTILRWTGTAMTPVGGAITLPTSLGTFGGNLLASGQSSFPTAENPAGDGISSWNGTTWSAFGTSAPGSVALTGTAYALAPMSNGELAIGGSFTGGSGTTTQNIVRWNGSSLTSFVSGANNSVLALLPMSNANLVVGGAFTSIGGVSANRVARWNGTAWNTLGSGFNNQVYALAQQSNGDIIAGGSFTTAGGAPANYIAKWDGTAWLPLGSGMNNVVYSLVALADGTLIAGGDFLTAGGTSANRIARWNGTSWQPLGTGVNSTVRALTLLNGDIIAAGAFSTAGGNSAGNIARWNGSTWATLGSGLNGQARALWVSNGQLVAAGDFTTAGGNSAKGIATWSGSTWSGYGTGLQQLSPSIANVYAATTLNGEVIAGGTFSSAGGVFATGVARWTAASTPSIALQPQPQTLSDGDLLTLTAKPSSGYSGVAFQWRRNNVNIVNGLGGASPGGGTVAGSAGTLASPTAAQVQTLTISGAKPSDTGDYSIVYSNPCGDTFSAAATVAVTVSCPGDLNSDNLVDDQDFVLFAAAYDLLDCADPIMPEGCPADLTLDGFVDDADFVDFAAAYDQLICP